MAFLARLRRFVQVLAPSLIWLGAGITAVLTIATVTVDRVSGRPIGIEVATGVIASLVLAAFLPLVLKWPDIGDARRYMAASIVATVLVFVTRPEGIIGGSVALAGGVIGVLRSL